MKKRWIVLIAVIVLALAGGGFYLHWYYQPVPFYLEAQMCNKEGDVHDIVIDAVLYRYIDRDNRFEGTITLDGAAYSGVASAERNARFHGVISASGFYRPVQGEGGRSSIL